MPFGHKPGTERQLWDAGMKAFRGEAENIQVCIREVWYHSNSLVSWLLKYGLLPRH